LETKVRFAGVASITDTPVAVLGPLFVTVTVYVMLLPAKAELAPVFVIDTSVEAVTVVEAVAELFAEIRSNAVVDTVAVLEIDPVNAGLMV
jgi:hypothetical protein